MNTLAIRLYVFYYFKAFKVQNTSVQVQAQDTKIMCILKAELIDRQTDRRRRVSMIAFERVS